MSHATEVLERINRGEEFNSEYTAVSDIDLSIMQVDEDALFAALTQEEKMKFSFPIGNYFILNIWRCHWMYVTELSQWVLVYKTNNLNADFNWNPEFIRLDDQHILDTVDAKLYKRI
jgi:hypothetical protein